MDLTVLIITKNSADTLEQTLISVHGFAKEIVVVDDYSTDKTKEIALRYGSRIVLHREYDFGRMRSFALSSVRSEWTLVLDSDEVLTEKGREEIKCAISQNAYDGYHVPFRNHLFGKKLLHGELHKKLVLFRTKKASISQKIIHEQYGVEGNIGTLSEEILHYSYRSVPQIYSKFIQYAIRQAKEYKLEKKQYGFRQLFINPLHMFYARLVLDEGYKDGAERIILDSGFACMEFLSYFFIPFVKTKTRISIDCGSYAVGSTVQSGIDRLIQGIASGMSKDSNYYWFSFQARARNRLPSRFFSSVWLPLATLFNRCDVFYGIAGNIPALLAFFPLQKILFLHDFGFFTTPEKYVGSASRLQSQTDRSVRIADKIVFFHREIEKEFIKRYPQYCYKAEVIPAGADHLEGVEEVPLFIQEKKPLVLYVGVVKPVKQIEKLISAVGKNYCIIAGSQERYYKEGLVVNKNQDVQFISNFSDGQLKWLYSRADVLVNPSLHEGYCYPALEALTMGVPVVAFDLPLFREYQTYFPHLRLVQTEKELKKELGMVSEKRKIVVNDHPYKWAIFNEQLQALWRPRRSPKTGERKIGFIIVLYQTSTSEKRRLENEIRQLGLKNSEVYWIDNSTNSKGYAAGVNEGIRNGLVDGCDVFFALNPDISLAGLRQESILLPAAQFGVWGYGMRQNKKIYFGGEFDPWRLSGGLVTKKPRQKYTSVDFVSGSCIGFTKEVVQTIGLWDESYFLYCEDMDFCQRARRTGFLIGIDTTVVYDHYETSQKNKEKAQLIAKSRWKFFWNYANLLQKIRETIRLPKTLTES